MYVALLVLRYFFVPKLYEDGKLLINSSLITVNFLIELFRPMGLPSAGFLPFMQTMMCDLSGKPSANYSTDMPIFPNAKYY